MNHRGGLIRFAPFLLAILIGAGALGVWGMALIWSQGILGGWLFQQKNESLEVTAEGRVLVRSMQRIEGARWSTTYRTLEGQDVDEQDVTSAAQYYLPSDRSKKYELGWTQRIVGNADLRTHPVYWFDIRDRYAPGQSYFALFDSQTKEAIGYFGAQGFSSTRPVGQERFSEVPLNGVVTLVDSRRNRGDSVRSRANVVFLITAGELWRIDMTARTSVKIAIPGEPVTLAAAGVYTPLDVADEFKQRVVVRTREQILLLDPAGKQTGSLDIPTALRNLTQYVYFPHLTDVPTTVLTSLERDGPTQVYWLVAGQEPRHAEVQLGDPGVDSSSLIGWYMAAIVPSPIIHASLLSLFAEQEVVQGTSESFADSLRRVWRHAWPAAVALAVLSAILSVICCRHHRRYSKRGSVAWAFLVLLFGLPVAVGYWLHRTWPARDACPHCQKTVPRNRGECLLCAAEFPMPALRGIEILA